MEYTYTPCISCIDSGSIDYIINISKYNDDISYESLQIFQPDSKMTRITLQFIIQF